MVTAVNDHSVLIWDSSKDSFKSLVINVSVIESYLVLINESIPLDVLLNFQVLESNLYFILSNHVLVCRAISWNRLKELFEQFEGYRRDLLRNLGYTDETLVKQLSEAHEEIEKITSAVNRAIEDYSS